VNFAVRKFPGYGRLSGKSLDDLRAGERVEVDATKHDPLDFVLWKRAKPGELKWSSPWGEGRPGWHIECSAMSCALLGEHFDIHGGGEDLQFPHHENEIAQSEGVSGRKFVNYWLHNGFLRLDDEKMSKSLGNFFTIRDILATYDAEVVRFMLLRPHYRSPFNYTPALMDDAKAGLTRLYTALKGAPASNGSIDWEEPHAQRFRGAMDDDFGTPQAVAVLFDLAREIGRGHAELAPQLRALGGVLGLLQRDAEAFLQWQPPQPSNVDGVYQATDSKSIEKLIKQRDEARSRRDYAEADRIRAELEARGIVLEDGANVTSWRRR